METPVFSVPFPFFGIRYSVFGIPFSVFRFPFSACSVPFRVAGGGPPNLLEFRRYRAGPRSSAAAWFQGGYARIRP